MPRRTTLTGRKEREQKRLLMNQARERQKREREAELNSHRGNRENPIFLEYAINFKTAQKTLELKQCNLCHKRWFNFDNNELCPLCHKFQVKNEFIFSIENNMEHGPQADVNTIKTENLDSEQTCPLDVDTNSPMQVETLTQSEEPSTSAAVNELKVIKVESLQEQPCELNVDTNSPIQVNTSTQYDVPSTSAPAHGISLHVTNLNQESADAPNLPLQDFSAGCSTSETTEGLMSLIPPEFSYIFDSPQMLVFKIALQKLNQNYKIKSNLVLNLKKQNKRLRNKNAYFKEVIQKLKKRCSQNSSP